MFTPRPWLRKRIHVNIWASMGQEVLSQGLPQGLPQGYSRFTPVLTTGHSWVTTGHTWLVRNTHDSLLGTHVSLMCTHASLLITDESLLSTHGPSLHAHGFEMKLVSPGQPQAKTLNPAIQCVICVETCQPWATPSANANSKMQYASIIYLGTSAALWAPMDHY